MKIEKKTWPGMFQKILDGDKTFDLRVADFNAEEGDTLVLREFDPKTNQYTGRSVEKIISFVLRTKDLNFYDPLDVKKYGFIIMALEPR
ncbi:MAG: hypothetical protein A3D59_02745 [Candidatus Wildermuthbacteria bacterium RIFCSPHIGHO2_02_FULL_47_17]|uniref:DUF3850 domain-containing protein n=1 Tax=Candidatus Wildermuthbacteria bacterium RIFCSPHIGHO2_02_FULL_47_17 TaxID=1802452 RepID=A0A1G2R6J9_9BACT|nr:MAG: hypothetical protein A3D59_02745 [Candidatus Wildermuthbacteria bacterium RIFCSPHIGHO2_02_FULL_47_17]